MSGALAGRESDSNTTLQCAHCGLQTRMDDPAAWGYTRGEQQNESTAEASESQGMVFCCHGCMGAYALIHGLGLEDFYSLRELTEKNPHPVRHVRSSEVLRDLEAAGVQVEAFSDGLCRVRLGVDGLHCAACSWLIESVQPSIQGLRSARVRWSDASVELIYDPSKTHPKQVADHLSRLGYALRPWTLNTQEDAEQLAIQREHWKGIAVAFFLAANAMWIGISLYAGEATGMASSHALFLRWTGAILGLLSALFPGRVFFLSAWQSLKARVPHVDVPVAIGLFVGTIGSFAGAALGSSDVYFDSLASLVLLLRVGRYIQYRAQYRSGLSISKLLRFQEMDAVRISEDGSETTVPAYRLQCGDMVRVLAGEKVPADGVVERGESYLQTAFLTGESRPRSVAVGEDVIGGTLNLRSPLWVRVRATAADSRLGKLNELIRQASADRTPLIQLADRVGGVFVLVVLAIALGTAITWWMISGWQIALEHTIALLTIACPCALALAAPLVITVALGRAAREGIWIRDGNSLERLANPGTIWFDKTGTLTTGDLRVIGWDGPDWVLPGVFAIESQSDHPVARSLCAYLQPLVARESQLLVKASQVEQIYGLGVQGIVCSHHRTNRFLLRGDRSDLSSCSQSQVVGAVGSCEVGEYSAQMRVRVEVDGELVGVFILGDALRPGVVETLVKLQEMGWEVGLLSGDSVERVHAFAELTRRKGVTWKEVIGGVSPEEKLQRIAEPDARPRVMVGDGVNDAAALAIADVGIAIRGPSEISLRNAPIYIGEDPLGSLLRLIDASKRTVWGIYRCFAASLIYNTITISLAASGLIHPLLAAIFMPISGITVLIMAWSAQTFPPITKKGSEH